MSEPPPSPKVEGKGPIIRRFDDVDVPFQAVRAQRNADGSESYVREKWFAFSRRAAVPLALRDVRPRAWSCAATATSARTSCS